MTNPHARPLTAHDLVVPEEIRAAIVEQWAGHRHAYDAMPLDELIVLIAEEEIALAGLRERISEINAQLDTPGFWEQWPAEERERRQFRARNARVHLIKQQNVLYVEIWLHRELLSSKRRLHAERRKEVEEARQAGDREKREGRRRLRLEREAAALAVLADECHPEYRLLAQLAREVARLYKTNDTPFHERRGDLLDQVEAWLRAQGAIPPLDD